jgi:two-component system, NarL family, response regulator NreC
MALRVGIVDDHRLFREGIKELLATVADVSVVAEADSAAAARRIVDSEDVDLLLVDWRLPDLPGDVLLREIHRRKPSLLLVALTMFGDERHVADAFAAGASGYVCKELGVAELVKAIRLVRAGGRYLPPTLDGHGRDDGFALLSRAPNGDSPMAALTRREREIFTLVVRGLRTTEIATQLEISGRTVETHRGRILRKLRVHSTSDLVRLAARHGLLET